jgi:muramidase (phage lysozyme)
MSPNLSAFLAVIRHCEGTSGPDGYRTIVGGGRFDSYSDHPRKLVSGRFNTGDPWGSTAAGAYQFLAGTWDEAQKALDLPDFSPESQDRAAVWLIERRGALQAVEAGNLRRALELCNREWASLPGSPYGQPTHTYEECERVFLAAGGTIAAPIEERSTPDPGTEPAEPVAPAEPAEPATPPEDKPMLPFIAAAIPALIDAAPDLIRVFGGKDQQRVERNAKAAEIVAGIAKTATNASTEQEAVERIVSDPQAAESFRAAIKQQWYELVEVGGGIAAARRADLAVMQIEGPWWSFLRSPSFWALVLLLPLVYLIVLSIIGVLGGVEWSMDVRAQTAGMVVGTIIGGAVGYYWGQTTSRNRTSAPPA